jgi:hypothetical protein
MANQSWLTTAGVDKIVNALAATTPFNITKWKIGDTEAVPFNQSLTDIVGTLQDSGTVSEMEFDIISQDNIIIRVILEESKGPYLVGNVGLFSDDDTLIAIGTFENARIKTPNAVGVVGNRLVLNIPINFVDVQSSINFTIYTNTFSSWPYVQTIADLPAPGLSPFEGYIVREDPSQNRPITAIRNEEPNGSGNFVWTYDYHNLITGDANANNNRYEIDTSTGLHRGYIGGQERLVLETDGLSLPTTTEPQTKLEIGQGRTTDGYAFVDLIGDSTYTDYGLRMIRNNTGLNANSELIHRGTGQFIFTSPELSSFRFNIAGLADSLTMTQDNTQINKPNTANIATLRVNNPLGNNSYGIVGELVISDNSPSTIDKPSILFTSNEGGITTTWSVGYGSGGGAGPSDRYFRIRENHTPAGWGAERFRLRTGTAGGGFAGNDFLLGFEVTARGDSGASRALVKETGNRLFINYASDYTGGTVVNSNLDVTGSFFAAGSLSSPTSVYAGNLGSSYAQLDSGGSLELASTGAGAAFIDFKNASIDDYDARITQQGASGLDFICRFGNDFSFIVNNTEVKLTIAESGGAIGDSTLRITEDNGIVSSNYRLLDGYLNGSEKFRIDHEGNYNGVGFVKGNGGIIAGTSGNLVQEIQNISNMYAGIVNSAGTAISLPGGWSSSYLGSGRYQVNHNKNNSNYSVVTTTRGSAAGGSTIENISSNFFIVQIKDSSNNVAIQLDFNFICTFH